MSREPEKELGATLEHGRAEDERWHIRKDGSRFYASGVMRLLKDSELEGFVKICRDQTAKIEAEQSALEKEMLRGLVSAQEDERRRIARDIHDHFCQQSALDDLGLRAALANFVGEWSKHSGIDAEFHASGLQRTRLDYVTETNLYRIAQEPLTNAHKHSGSKRVSVLLEKSHNKVSLINEDDGIGFNPNEKANRTKGIGLVGMSERAKICGGELEIESANGKGTTFFARIPVKGRKIVG